MIPILVGGSFKIGGGAFGYGEVGLTNVRVSFDSASASETYLDAGAGGGFRAGKILGRVGLWMPGRPSNNSGGSTNTTTLYGVLGSVDFDFATL